jgi:DDE_Tnp_1-associated
MDTIFEGESPRARLTLVLRHFSELKDDREPWRIVYPLKEVLLLVTCATIASSDDFDDIVAWGKHHLHFLRQFSDLHHSIPCERWLRLLVNRMDPALFGRCFKSWVAALWPGRHDLIAIDGKTARRTHDHRKDIKALHTLSAYATIAVWSWRRPRFPRSAASAPSYAGVVGVFAICPSLLPEPK